MGIGLFPLFLVVDELLNGELCLPFGDLGLRKREYRSFWHAENGGHSPMEDFALWLVEAGHETEQFMQDWASAAGLQFSLTR